MDLTTDRPLSRPARAGHRQSVDMASRRDTDADNSRINGGIITALIFEVLLSALWEAFLQIAGQVLIEVGLGTIGHSFQQRSRAHPVIAGIGVVLLGALVGAAASVVWPSRVFDGAPVRGASLVLSPIIAGAAMEGYGRWCDKRDKARSYVASFWGGGLFALSMASVRFIWVGR